MKRFIKIEIQLNFTFLPLHRLHLLHRHRHLFLLVHLHHLLRHHLDIRYSPQEQFHHRRLHGYPCSVHDTVWVRHHLLKDCSEVVEAMLWQEVQGAGHKADHRRAVHLFNTVQIINNYTGCLSSIALTSNWQSLRFWHAQPPTALI